MAITITISDVREVCPTSFVDAVITRMINSVQAKIGTCVEDSYDADTAAAILIAAVCHFLVAMDGGDIKSERAPNGSSTTFENHASGEGLKSTSHGRMLLMLDTELCYVNLVAQTFLFLAAGDPAEPCQ